MALRSREAYVSSLSEEQQGILMRYPRSSQLNGEGTVRYARRRRQSSVGRS